MNVEKRIDAINEFLVSRMNYFDHYVKQLKDIKNLDMDKLDRLFREALKEVWV